VISSLNKPLQLKHKIMVFAACAVVVLWVAVLLVFAPQRARLAALDASYQTERRQVEAIEAYGLAHPDTNKHMAELDARRITVDRLLPATPAVSDFLVLVEKAARTGGVQLQHVRPAAAAAKNGYQETPLEILVRGDFFQTVAFLRQLEDGTRFNAITAIGVGMKQGVLESKLQVVIYNLKK
jgi:Tfp pilus assembly protein PilO